jgi:hypothetical protein
VWKLRIRRVVGGREDVMSVKVVGEVISVRVDIVILGTLDIGRGNGEDMQSGGVKRQLRKLDEATSICQENKKMYPF